MKSIYHFHHHVPQKEYIEYHVLAVHIGMEKFHFLTYAKSRVVVKKSESRVFLPRGQKERTGFTEGDYLRSNNMLA